MGLGLMALPRKTWSCCGDEYRWRHESGVCQEDKTRCANQRFVELARVGIVELVGWRRGLSGGMDGVSVRSCWLPT